MTADKPTVPEVLPLVHKLFERGVGCCLHIVLDEGNVEDSHVEFCNQTAIASGHEQCIFIAGLLKKMSRTQRRKLAACAYEKQHAKWQEQT